jgi:glyoxylase-like metal-dependent hydrolase (beta-lactamase superfamily II)
MPRFLILALLLASTLSAQTPDWCKSLPRPAYAKLKRVQKNVPWFEVYQVAPGVYAIYEPHQWEEVISYLIVGRKRALLFDTGMGIADITQPVDRITKLAVYVLNSHTHNDHVGDNWRFSHIYGMDTPFTRVNAKGSRADAQAEIAPGTLCGALPAGFDRKGYSTRPFRITDVVRDGSKIDLGGRVLEVLATPGHTPDAISLLDRKNGLLFTGDSFYLGPIFLYRPETDLAAYERSVLRLRALTPQVKLLLPAHNTPTAPPSYLSKLAVAIRQVRSGKAKGDPKDGRLDYPFEGFSLLLAARK